MKPIQLELISHQPSSANNFNYPILFVHGAWHGAWCWEEYFLPYFVKQGFEVHALSLRGHGTSESDKSIRFTRMKDYVTDVEQVVAALGQDVVLVGHSMGGFIVQKYLEKHTPKAAILLAPAPNKGVLNTTLRVARKYPLQFLKMNTLWTMFPLVENNKLAKAQFFSDDMPAAVVEKHQKRLQEESFLGFLDMLLLDLPRKINKAVPMLVLGAENDQIFKPSEIHATAKHYNASIRIFEDMAHDMMLEANWSDVADEMIRWLNHLVVNDN